MNYRECCECGYDLDQIEMKPCPICGKIICEECFLQNIHRCNIEVEWQHIEDCADDEDEFECPSCGCIVSEDEAFFSEYLDDWVCIDCVNEATEDSEDWMDNYLMDRDDDD